VRITSARSSLRLEGHTGQRPFVVPLDRALSYEVLVIPDGALTAVEEALAPKIFANITPDFPRPMLVVDRGVPVSDSSPARADRWWGRGCSCAPLCYRRRSGYRTLSVALRSTRAAAPLAPSWSHHPAPGSRRCTSMNAAVVVEETGLSLDFQWRAVPRSNLELAVQTAEGSSPAPGVTVRLETEDLPDVGTMTLAGGITLAAAGRFASRPPPVPAASPPSPVCRPPRTP
jgi:hypothetical protein